MTPSSTRHFDAAKLREAQARMGLTNEALALNVGCSLRLLQKWRAGTVEPSGRYLMALASSLGVLVEFFYVETEAAA